MFIIIYEQANKQTSKQTNKQTNKHANNDYTRQMFHVR